jgi:hypothetical protein
VDVTDVTQPQVTKNMLGAARVLGKYSFWEVIIEFPKIVVGWQYLDTGNKALFIQLMDLDFRVWNSFPRIQKMTCSLVLAIQV